MPNPYTPPAAPVDDREKHGRRRPVLIAGLIGGVVDYCGTFAFGVATSIAVALVAASFGAGTSDVGALFRSGHWQAFNLAAGAAFTALGGYVAARIANHRELMSALVVGVLAIVSGEVTIAMSEDYELWMRIAGDLIAIPVALMGGWRRRVERTKPAAA